MPSYEDLVGWVDNFTGEQIAGAVGLIIVLGLLAWWLLLVWRGK